MHSTPITTGCRARPSHRPPTGPGAHESTPSRRWPSLSACPARPLDIDIDIDIDTDIDRPASPETHAARRCPAATSPRPCVLLFARAMDAVLITNPRAPHNRILSEPFKQKQNKRTRTAQIRYLIAIFGSRSSAVRPGSSGARDHTGSHGHGHGHGLHLLTAVSLAHLRVLPYALTVVSGAYAYCKC